MALLEEIQFAIDNAEFDLTLHAQIQMTSRRIAAEEVRRAIHSKEAQVIEDYPNDPRAKLSALWKDSRQNSSYSPQLSA